MNLTATAHKSGDFGHFWACPAIRNDEKYWIALAAARDIRLPNRNTPCTSRGMEHWLRRLGLTPSWLAEWSGYYRLGDWMAANPGWPLRAFVGLLMEEL